MAKSTFQLSDGTPVTTAPPEEQGIEGFSVKAFVDELREDLIANRIALPTLPNIAVEALLVINDIDSSVDDLVRVISRDTSLTARLIRYANSPLLRGVTSVTAIKPAITRIGFQQVKNAVYAVSMKEVFRTSVKMIEGRMEALWNHSVKVGSLAAAVARECPGLDSDVALVAGLIHDIGKIPLLTKACDYPELTKKPEYLDNLVAKLHSSMGSNILKAWKFDPALIAVAADHEKLNRDPGDAPVDYVDIIQVANVMAHAGTDHPLATIDRSTIRAFARAKIGEGNQEQTAENAQAISDIFF